MLSRLSSSESRSDSSGLRPPADCDLDRSRETEPDLCPRCMGMFGEGERPWLVRARSLFSTDGLHDPTALPEASFMLFALTERMESSRPTSMEAFEGDPRGAGRGTVDRTVDCMVGGAVAP